MRLFKRKLGLDGQLSYSQCGEDVIVAFLLELLKIESPTYLDIGAHHPTRLNNTYLLYKRGCRGVNVEPDPNLIRAFHRLRKRDVNVNVGIGPKAGKLDFFVMSVPTLNTFSEAEARRCERESGFKIVEKLPIEVMTFDAVVARHLGRTPDFVSVDVEGYDLEVLRSIDFAKHRPRVFCVETLSFSQTRATARKNEAIHALLHEAGYRTYADTYVNTIYVDEKIWAIS
ncbi:MAG: FkbM family methyltransferase [Deltaproteobacteria bacterium]|nr:FkbM family methyltransferase [Deltaproteobacteria bacterium]